MYSRCLSLIFAWLLPAALHAAELRVCADPDNLPYSDRAERGFENRVARLMAAELGAELKYAWHPQQRAFVRKTIGAGLCDVWIGVPSDFERVLTTRPYYRSTYVFVFRPGRPLRSFDDPDVKRLKIGVQLPGDDLAATPPGHVLASLGAVDNVKGYTLHGPRPSAERIIDAIGRGELDAGIVWGPQAGFFAAQRGLEVAPAEAPEGRGAMPFVFAVSIGVRRGEKALRDALDAALERRRADVAAILDAYALPRVP